MAPLSILPGRVRFEDPRLVGNETLSRHLETNIAVMAGVDLVSASHRTGRILVEFSEAQLTRDELVAHISGVFSLDVPFPDSTARKSKVPEKEFLLSGSILADVALHLLLPAPFDLLLPAFGSSFQRGRTQHCIP